jgi:hypothetical protein
VVKPLIIAFGVKRFFALIVNGREIDKLKKTQAWLSFD